MNQYRQLILKQSYLMLKGLGYSFKGYLIYQ